MTQFIPEHTTADLDLVKRNQMLTELLIEEFDLIPDTWLPMQIEEHLKMKVIDRFNINHPEYNALISYDITPTGTHITAYVTRRLALVKLTVSQVNSSPVSTWKKEECQKTKILKFWNWLISLLK